MPALLQENDLRSLDDAAQVHLAELEHHISLTLLSGNIAIDINRLDRSVVAPATVTLVLQIAAQIAINTARELSLAIDETLYLDVAAEALANALANARNDRGASTTH